MNNHRVAWLNSDIQSRGEKAGFLSRGRKEARHDEGFKVDPARGGLDQARDIESKWR